MCKGRVVAALALQASQWARCGGQGTQTRSKGWQGHFRQDHAGHNQKAGFSISAMDATAREGDALVYG